jgi:hypothetical protein
MTVVRAPATGGGVELGLLVFSTRLITLASCWCTPSGGLACLLTPPVVDLKRDQGRSHDSGKRATGK